MAECGGGQGLHHIQPRPGPSNDLLAVRPEGHTSVHGQTQDLGRRADQDGSASQGDHELLPKLAVCGVRRVMNDLTTLC